MSKPRSYSVVVRDAADICFGAASMIFAHTSSSETEGDEGSITSGSDVVMASP